MLTSELIVKVREQLCKQLSAMGQNGFGYLEPVLRTALFVNEPDPVTHLSTINWEKVAGEFCKHNPEWWGEVEP